MNTFTKEIDEKSKSSVQRETETRSAITELTDNYDQITDSFDESEIMVSGIMSHIQSVAAFMQELTASTQEISASMYVITDEVGNISNFVNTLTTYADASEEMKNDLDHIGEEYLNITNLFIDPLNNGSHTISNKYILSHLERTIQSHIKWLQELTELAKKGHLQAIQSDASKCSLGYFYNAIEPQNEKVLEIWQKLKGSHRELHRQCSEIKTSIAQKNQ